jgi:hypothetical protein
MAFGGYEVSRSNIYNANTHDYLGCYYTLKDTNKAVNSFISENKTGDVICVWETDTEYDSLLVMSVFNNPVNGIEIELLNV